MELVIDVQELDQDPTLLVRPTDEPVTLHLTKKNSTGKNSFRFSPKKLPSQNYTTNAI